MKFHTMHCLAAWILCAVGITIGCSEDSPVLPTSPDVAVSEAQAPPIQNGVAVEQRSASLPEPPPDPSDPDYAEQVCNIGGCGLDLDPDFDLHQVCVDWVNFCIADPVTENEGCIAAAVLWCANKNLGSPGPPGRPGGPF